MKNEMRTAILVAIVIAILGIVGFLYRAAVQAPQHATNTSGTTSTACTAEVKVCPDGTSVSRTGPSCAFSACELPNIELPQAQLAFALPASFTQSPHKQASDVRVLGLYQKAAIASTSTTPDTITVSRYAIAAGQDANAVMLANTVYESSGTEPKSMNEFTPVIINGKTYQMLTVERFEAIVHVVYYLPRATDVLGFEVVQHDVSNWSDVHLNVRELGSVKALESMLATVQTP